MQHDFPWLPLAIPFSLFILLNHLHIVLALLVQFPLFLRLFFNLAFIFVFRNRINYFVTHKSSSVGGVIQDWEAEMGEMHTYLMSPSCYWIAFQQCAITLLVEPDFPEHSLRFLWKLFFSISLLSFLLFFYFFFSNFIILIEFLEGPLCMHFVNPIFMGHALEARIQYHVGPRNLPSHSSIIHLFHPLIFAFLMELCDFFCLFGEKYESGSAFVQSMQDMEILIAVLKLKKSHQGIEMEPPTSVDHDAWGLIHDNKLLILMDYFQGQVQNGRLLPQGLMDNLVSVFYFVVQPYNFPIDFDGSTLQGSLVIVCIICLKLLDKHLVDGTTQPPSLRKCLVGVGVWPHTQERVRIVVYGLNHFFYILKRSLPICCSLQRILETADAVYRHQLLVAY